jgi:hypothetical protein
MRGGLRLIDGIAPFFAGLPVADTNWSKAPFARLEREGGLDPARADAVAAAFDRYCAAVAALGYDAVAIDDLAHLVAHPWYPGPLRRLLRGYADLYARLFAAARRHGMAVYALTDYCFFHPAIDARLAETGEAPLDVFAETVDAAFARWPELAGVVVRIGEADGVDVAGEETFASRLVATRPDDARALLRRLLPEFEAAGKTLILRTWTLGAGPVGDLLWNPATYDAVFAGLDSPALVVSIKYGPADFFRFLETNPTLFRGPQRKLVEFQCRREYEGMGEFPSFAGWLYADHLARLRAGGANLAGVYAVQAGGWAPWGKLGFAGDGNVWSELNALAVARLWHGDDPETAVRRFCAGRGIAAADRFLDLLRLSDRAIEDGLYIREFAAQALWFRRLRLPPLLWVFWRDVSVGGLVALLHRHLVRDKAGAVAEGRRAVDHVEEMLAIAVELGLPFEDLEFQLDSFRLFALLREVLLGVDGPETRRQLDALLPAYRDRYPDGYRVSFGPETDPLNRRPYSMALLCRLLLRPEAAYRGADRLLLNRHVSRVKARLAARLAGALPGFVGRQGMSPEALLR